MTLQGFFTRIPCFVPPDLSQRAQTEVFTLQEAVGFLRGAKDRLIRQVLINTSQALMKVPKAGSYYISDSSGKEVKVSVSFVLSQQIQKKAEETIGKITLVIEQKITELCTSCSQGLNEERVSQWLQRQFFMTIQRVAAHPEMVSLLQQHNITLPQFLSEANVLSFLDQLQDLFCTNVPEIVEVKKSIKSWFFSIVGQNLPESMLHRIQLLPMVPDMKLAMKQAGLSFPPFITRDNVAQWLLQVDDRLDQPDAAANELQRVLKPCLDELLEKSL